MSNKNDTKSPDTANDQEAVEAASMMLGELLRQNRGRTILLESVDTYDIDEYEGSIQ